ncbi:MAG: glycosyltransferase, partial [Deltaproteobacteria bacterium]|nr:glycosyltransferase [Deltaproteobacteria bacterium]
AKERAFELQDSFQKCLPFYKKRGSVVFLSYCRYWEQHGFVQQSLARLLTENGVKVIWLDGSGWRPYRPVRSWDSKLLRISQLFEFPGRRLFFMDRISEGFQKGTLRKIVRELGSPVIWVQAGMNERIVEALPYIDIFSTFDDPYRHGPTDVLCEKAKTIVCQNSFTFRIMSSLHAEKTIHLLPPVDLPGGTPNVKSVELPAGFPKKVMGYIGSFFSYDYDLRLLENFVRSFPDWGFVLMGRTDPEGERGLARLRQYPNFISYPWVPRDQVWSAWRALDVSLLLYRPCRSQDGAFPVKILESFFCGIPCVCTAVPKTLDLDGMVPRSPFPEHLKKLAEQASQWNPLSVANRYHHFAYLMSPKYHLAKIAEQLQRHG